MAAIKELQQENEELQAVVQELEEQNRRLEQKILEIFTLYNVSKALSLSYQLEELLSVAVKMINGSLEVQDFGLYALNVSEKGGDSELDLAQHLALKIYEGEYAAGQPRVLDLESTNLIGDVFLRGTAVHLHDSGDAEYTERFWLDGHRGSVLAVPVSTLERSIPLGVLVARSKAIGGFGKDELRLFKSIAEHLAIAMENAEIFHRTQEMSFVDSLTGIYNRRYFEERLSRELSRAERYHRPFQILLIDVDNFKRINDTYGHPVGDYVLQQIAILLKDELRQSDVVARYGGDEFIVLLPESEGMASDKVMFKLRRALRGHKWEQFDARELGLGLTVGMASYPDDGLDPKELVGIADRELYRYKEISHNRPPRVPPSE